MAQLIFQAREIALRHEHQTGEMQVGNVLLAGQDREFSFADDPCHVFLSSHSLPGQWITGKKFGPAEDRAGVMNDQARQAALSQISNRRKLATVTSRGSSPPASQAVSYSARIDSCTATTSTIRTPLGW